jgi:hypothetical protein
VIFVTISVQEIADLAAIIRKRAEICMDGDKTVLRIFKWVGIVALVAVPIAVLLKRRSEKESSTESDYQDEADIFAQDLRD